MMLRGIRGAITVDSNTSEAILQATEELLRTMIAQNDVREEDVCNVFFTSTPDLTACYPAKAARNMGWRQTPLMGSQEVDVPDGLKRCIRVLIQWNTHKTQQEIQHIFLRDAVQLRPDLVNKAPATGE